MWIYVIITSKIAHFYKIFLKQLLHHINFFSLFWVSPRIPNPHWVILWFWFTYSPFAGMLRNTYEKHTNAHTITVALKAKCVSVCKQSTEGGDGLRWTMNMPHMWRDRKSSENNQLFLFIVKLCDIIRCCGSVHGPETDQTLVWRRQRRCDKINLDINSGFSFFLD